MKIAKKNLQKIVVLGIIMILIMKQMSTVEVSQVEAGKQEKVENIKVGAAVVLEADIELEQEEINKIVETAKETLMEEQESIEEQKEEEEKERQSGLVMVDVDNTLNVREERNQDSKKVGLLYKDCGGKILDQEDGWTKIQSGDLVGWADDEYLLFGEEAEALSKEVGRSIGTVNADALRMRKGPSEDAGVHGLVATNETLDLVREEGEWAVVNHEGSDGFLAKEHLDIEFVVDHGETMEEIQERNRLAIEAKAKLNVNYDAMPAGATDVELLAALIHCEAGGESYEGQLAVGSVVMNRVRSPGYPNTLDGVIFASGQFTPARNGKVGNRIAKGSSASAMQAATEVLNGVSNIGSTTRFRRNDGRPGNVIGNHVFW